MTESEPRVAGLLLAAGGSTRLGRPKQLVEFEGKTLIRRAAEAIIDAGCSPVIVVLGAEIEGSTVELKSLDVGIAINEIWKTGMSSSIRVGMQSLSDADAVLISLVDQPLIDGHGLRQLIAAFQASRAPIVAAKYNDVSGVPALFSSQIFEDLKKLDGAKGARSVIRNAMHVVTVDLPGAAVDIDTLSDLTEL